MFNCASNYGKAEQVLGKWIELLKSRDKIIFLSKCGDIKEGRVSVNRRVIMEQLNQSLEALHTDSIDIYLLQRDDPNTPDEEFIDTLNEAKEAGKKSSAFPTGHISESKRLTVMQSQKVWQAFRYPVRTTALRFRFRIYGAAGAYQFRVIRLHVHGTQKIKCLLSHIRV